MRSLAGASSLCLPANQRIEQLRTQARSWPLLRPVPARRRRPTQVRAEGLLASTHSKASTDLSAAPGVALTISEAPDGLSLAPGPLPLAEVQQTVSPSSEVASGGR